MKTCYLDANILVALKNEDSSFHQRAVILLESLFKNNYFLMISPLVLDEFLYVVLYLLKLKKKKNIHELLEKSLKDIFQIVKVINPPTSKKAQLRVVELMKKYNLRPRDAFHLLTILSSKIESCATFDSDFVQVKKKKLIKVFNSPPIDYN